MNKKYYLDTSIWLDIFEDRNEPNLPKSKFAQELMDKIIKENDLIIFSDFIIEEMKNLGYYEFEINNLFAKFNKIIICINASEKEINRARDLAFTREIPKKDAIHAILAKNNQAILITRDYHFKKVLDLIKYKKPEDII